MTDRELLELAAKAAGIEHGADRTECGLSLTGPDGRHRSLPRWNPLEDDGDALRLAVKLRLSVDHNHTADQHRWVAVDRNGCEGCYDPVSCVEDEFEEGDRFAATRRAIARVAAEIGKKMGERE